MPSPKITFHTLREEYNGRCLAEQVQQYLEEKLIILGKGANYGQVVFLAGGAGSGKGFTLSNYLEGHKFKVFNPDDFKDGFLKIRDNYNKIWVPTPGELSQSGGARLSQKTKDFIQGLMGLDLRNPGDTGRLHMLLKTLDLESKQLFNFFFRGRQTALGNVDKATLPNVIFDATLKDTGFLVGEKGSEGILSQLARIGYKKENIHVVWVLTDCKVAISQNFTRDRVVPTDILFQTHRGAAATMQDIIFKNYRSLGINGDIVTVLGGKNHIVQWAGDKWVDHKTGKTYKLERDLEAKVVTDFKYFRLKKQGENSIDQKAMERLREYILDYAPKPTDNVEKLEKEVIDSMRANGKMPSDVMRHMGKVADPKDIEYKEKKKEANVAPLAKWLEKLRKSQGA